MAVSVDMCDVNCALCVCVRVRACVSAGGCLDFKVLDFMALISVH